MAEPFHHISKTPPAGDTLELSLPCGTIVHGWATQRFQKHWTWWTMTGGRARLVEPLFWRRATTLAPPDTFIAARKAERCGP